MFQGYYIEKRKGLSKLRTAELTCGVRRMKITGVGSNLKTCQAFVKHKTPIFFQVLLSLEVCTLMRSFNSLASRMMNLIDDKRYGWWNAMVNFLVMLPQWRWRFSPSAQWCSGSPLEKNVESILYWVILHKSHTIPWTSSCECSVPDATQTRQYNILIRNCEIERSITFALKNDYDKRMDWHHNLPWISCWDDMTGCW